MLTLFLPNFELFKLEFSGCVFQADSFFAGKSWSKLSGYFQTSRKQTLSDFENSWLFFIPILVVLAATLNLARR